MWFSSLFCFIVCCRYVPDRSYLAALTAHLQTQLPLCDADALSMALWALAALQQPLPSESWGAAWCAAARAEADGFGPQALAHGLAGMAALKVQPSVGLMQSLTLAASGCLSSFSCMELGLMVAALADLHWRPSDSWMEVSEALIYIYVGCLGLSVAVTHINCKFTVCISPVDGNSWLVLGKDCLPCAVCSHAVLCPVPFFA